MKSFKTKIVLSATLALLMSFVFTINSFAANWPVLRQGARGHEVTAMQILLNWRGHSPGGTDGIFGPRTDAAVRNFQRSRRLTVDGAAGPNTLSNLVGTVRQGDRNEAVRAAQFLLRNKFGMNIAVDGVFGPQTRDATLAFQRAHGLSADGVIGPNTWRTLFGARARSIPMPQAQTPQPQTTQRNGTMVRYDRNNPNQLLIRSNGQTTPYFRVREVMCGPGNPNSSCNRSSCPRFFYIDSRLVDVLHATRGRVGPLIVTGPLRCTAHASTFSSGTGSFHARGLAVDVRSGNGSATLERIYDAAIASGAVGGATRHFTPRNDTYISRSGNFVHVAVRP